MPARTQRSEIISSRQKSSQFLKKKTKRFKYPAMTECWFKQKEKQLRSAGCCSLLWSPLTTEATIWTLEHRLNTEEKSSQRHGHITLLKWRQSVQLIWFDYRAHGWADRESERQRGKRKAFLNRKGAGQTHHKKGELICTLYFMVYQQISFQ